MDFLIKRVEGHNINYELNEDQKISSIKTIDDTLHALITFKDWVKNNELTEEMALNLITVTNHKLSDLTKIFKLTELKNEIDGEKQTRIFQLLDEIKNLKQEITSNQEYNNIFKEKINYMMNLIRNWWMELGFGSAECSLEFHAALKIDFRLDLDSHNRFLLLEEKPHSKVMIFSELIKNYINEGFEFNEDFEINKENYNLKDTDNNKKLIEQKIKSYLPSFNVYHWESHICMYNSMNLSKVWGYLHNYSDLNNLIKENNNEN